MTGLPWSIFFNLPPQPPIKTSSPSKRKWGSIVTGSKPLKNFTILPGKNFNFKNLYTDFSRALRCICPNMSRLENRIIPFVLKWVPFLFARNRFISPNPCFHCNGLCRILQHLRFSSTERAVNLGELAKISRLAREEAQAALVEYFHSTSTLDIMDAENMSKNTPNFFEKLVGRVEIGGDGRVGRSLTRFLRYHPVNEFEPFFESIGLKPSEYSSFLPHDLMFLSDDVLLMENYRVLCNYGVARNRIGKIYRVAREVFGYDCGVLLPKLQSFQNLELRQSLVVKIIASSPRLLIGNVDRGFIEVLQKLKKVGIEHEWLEEHIKVEDDPYNWRRMLELMNLLRKSGLSEEQLRQILILHPDILLEHSGLVTFCLFGFLLKFGSTLSNIRNFFLEFPNIPLARFTHNFLFSYEFLVQINMDAQDIGSIICSYPMVLGLCELKKAKTLLSELNCSQKTMCHIVKDDPCVLKKWVLRAKVSRLQEQSRVVRVRIQKTEFLMSLGFVENSKEMEKAMKKIRGKGVELQHRFNCLVKFGLSREEALKMINVAPQILNQSTDTMEAKADYLVKKLGYPFSDLVRCPKLMCYTIKRVKLRLLMYKWLMGKGSVRANLALSTLVSCKEEKFVRLYVNSHPRGHEHWNRLKK